MVPPQQPSSTAVMAQRQEREGAAQLLVAAAEWAELHPAAEGAAIAGWGSADLHGEGVIPLGGPGSPLVAEFAPMELAAVLGLGHEAGKSLIADALELKHRLPRLWELVCDLRVAAWTARRIAALTTDLSKDAANQADRMVCGDPDHVGAVRAERLVDEIRLYFDPDRAVAAEEQSLNRRGVWLHEGSTAATTEVTMSLDTLDALLLNDSVSDVARQLSRLGDTDSVDVRRAKAVGVLADPQRALDLLTTAEDPGAARNAPAVLFLHVCAAALAKGQPGTVDFERLGVASTELVRDWLGRTDFVVRPVLDLCRADAVDRHDPPSWMRELIVLRDATCVFPGCRRTSRACDLDHITEYVALTEGGPPGQTRPDNLAPLCRGHHRAKTH
ncbi:MAG: HNH endonuclease, partial [Actinomycetota bacterium]|nr:HNH endonuclease [Actinomycetota bacterium]